MRSTRFGQQVEKLQAEQGLSNKDLAQKLGVTPSRVSSLKNTIRPHFTTIHRLSRIFEVDAALFLNDDR